MGGQLYPLSQLISRTANDYGLARNQLTYVVSRFHDIILHVHHISHHIAITLITRGLPL